MSQNKASRKAPALHKEQTRQPIPISEDKDQKQCIKGKNKIPKNVRYDLENSLLSLCDVWFEEIKPYLVRNNVKVHVHDVAADVATGAAEGGGDHQRLPVGRPGCSHLDPGAASHPPQPLAVNCVDYCSMPRTASRVQYHKQQASPPSPMRPCRPPMPPRKTRILHPCNQSEEKIKYHRQLRRKPVLPQNVISADKWKVPRPCRAYNVVAAKPPPSAIVSQLPLSYPTIGQLKHQYHV